MSADETSLVKLTLTPTRETAVLFDALSVDRQRELVQRFEGDVREQAQLEAAELAERAASLRAVLDGDGGSSLQPSPASAPPLDAGGRIESGGERIIRAQHAAAAPPRRRPPAPARAVTITESDVLAAFAEHGPATRRAIAHKLGANDHAPSERFIADVVERNAVPGGALVEAGTYRRGVRYRTRLPLGGPGESAIAATRERLDGARGGAARVAREAAGGAQAATSHPPAADPASTPAPDPDARRRAAITQHAAQSAAAAADAAESTKARRTGAHVGDLERRERLLDEQILRALRHQGPGTVPDVMGRLLIAGIDAPASIVTRRLQQLERDGDVAKSPPGIYRLEERA